MSAQAVLSLIAPTMPATPQGAADVDASGFQGLLDTLLAADAAMGDLPANPPPAAGEESLDRASGMVSFLIAPPVDAAPVPPAVVASPLSTAPTTAPTGLAEEVEKSTAAPGLSAPSAAAGALADASDPLVPAAPTDAGAPQARRADKAPAADGSALAPEPSIPSASGTSVGAAVSKDVAPSTPSAPAQTTVAPSASQVAAAPSAPAAPADNTMGKDVAPPVRLAPARPAVIPPASGSAADAPDPQAPVDGAAPAPASSPVSVAAKGPVEVESEVARTPKGGSMPATPVPPRALEERSSKRLDASASQTDPAAHSEGAAPATTTTPAPAPDSVTQPAKAIAAAPSVIEAGAMRPEPSVEPAPSSDTPTATTQVSGPDRDHGLSTLSRASIDATAQIAAQILRKLEVRSTRFEIALRPDELGRVDVKLDIDADGRLAARLAFDNPAAATDLRGKADELRRQLEAAGFQLADDAFEFTERDSGSSGFDRGQDARQGQSRAFAAAARLNADTDIAQPPQWLALSLSPSGVDMKV